MRQLQTGHPKELNCLLLINADVEAELHDKFAAHRMHGEWFDLRGSQVDDVRELYKNILSQQNHDFD
ncbi:MAG: hypothetical protein CMM01_19915 [Rhodopirellula sp.]|nr:hypothetical protein [Rhodopirellula sp.]